LEGRGNIIFEIRQREFGDHIKLIMGCFKGIVEMCFIYYRMFWGKDQR